MIKQIAASFLVITLTVACQSTKTAQRPTLRESHSRIAANSRSNNLNEPPPPAEGPEDVNSTGPTDVNRNPGLVPTPLLRSNAIGNP